MGRGVNKVILVGNTGNDPEIKYSQNGMAIASISLATTSVRKDKDGNQQEKTEWHRVKFFGKLAEIVGEYVTKGSSLYVEGRISYSEVSGDDGQKKYFTDIIGDEMQMLGGRNDGGNQGQGGQRREGNREGGGGQGGNSQRGGGNGGGQQQRAQPRQPEPAMAGGGNFGSFDEDIPFAP